MPILDNRTPDKVMLHQVKKGWLESVLKAINTHMTHGLYVSSVNKGWMVILGYLLAKETNEVIFGNI